MANVRTTRADYCWQMSAVRERRAGRKITENASKDHGYSVCVVAIMAFYIERRFFIGQRRDRLTLEAITKAEIKVATVVHSDECKAYNRLYKIAYDHKTVNHKKFFVGKDGTHMQTIEYLWSHLNFRMYLYRHHTCT